MFQSLRWKIAAAFSLTILFTIVLSGTLSAWMTIARFDVFVTDEGFYQAEEIAPLLEASYAITGDWSNLDELLAPSFSPEPWLSSVEWDQIVIEILGLDEESYFNQLEQSESLAAVAETRGVDPDRLVGGARIPSGDLAKTRGRRCRPPVRRPLPDRLPPCRGWRDERGQQPAERNLMD